MKVYVNKDVCIGCGACTAITDNKVFTFGDDGFAEVVKDIENIEDYKEEIEDAESGCPTGAIKVEEN